MIKKRIAKRKIVKKAIKKRIVKRKVDSVINSYSKSKLNKLIKIYSLFDDSESLKFVKQLKSIRRKR